MISIAVSCERWVKKIHAIKSWTAWIEVIKLSAHDSGSHFEQKTKMRKQDQFELSSYANYTAMNVKLYVLEDRYAGAHISTVTKECSFSPLEQ